MKTSWQTRPERGSDLLIRFMTWLSLNVGRRAGRLLLYPIAAYFFLFSTRSRAASRQYLSTVFQRAASNRQVFRHYHTFSSVILDRVFFLKGRMEDFELRIEGTEMFQAQLAKGKGCLLLGAHMGSFEVLRAFGVLKQKLPIKILMYPENSARIVRMIERINPDLAKDMIPLGHPDTMVRAKQHVDTGGLIGILGDRTARGENTVRTGFLGRPAGFPTGPMRLAALLKSPVILFCCLYKGDARYEIHLELFADEVVIDPERRQQDLQAWVHRYAERIEHYCRMDPYNWFNFYDFWEPPEAVA